MPVELYENSDQYDIDTALMFSSDYCSKTKKKLGQHHHVQISNGMDRDKWFSIDQKQKRHLGPD